MTIFLCGPTIYHFRGWLFECHSYRGPWPLRRDFSPRKRAGRRFWLVWQEFDLLPEEKRKEYEVDE
jgi:hypothetical protein